MLLPWSLVMGASASPWALSGTVAPYPTRSEQSKAAMFAAFEPLLFGRAATRWAQLLAWGRRLG